MFACYYYRRIIKSSLDADGALPEAARHHIQKCPACRKIYESESRLIRELRGNSGAPGQSPSPFLHAKIMASIARSGQAAEYQPHRGRAIWAVGLATACLLALVALWARQQAAVSREQAIVRALQSHAPFPVDLSLGVKLPDGNEVRQWAGKLDEPLEAEMTRVVSDAKTAFNSLADNFLPEKVRQSLFEQDKGS